jgi:hypothetical protein
VTDGGVDERIVAQNGAATHEGVAKTALEALALIN